MIEGDSRGANLGNCQKALTVRKKAIRLGERSIEFHNAKVPEAPQKLDTKLA